MTHHETQLATMSCPSARCAEYISGGLMSFRVAVLVTIAATPATAQQVTAFTHVRLIDGRGGAPLMDATVMVRGERIEAAGPAAEVAAPKGARIIDGRGMSLLPGLADMHTHLSGGWDGDTADYLGARLTTN